MEKLPSLKEQQLQTVETYSDYDDETQKLLSEPSDEPESSSTLSASRQRFMMGVILLLHFANFCADTALYPFFPNEAEKKGLTATQVGVVFAAFEFARFVAAPIFGSLLLKFPPKGMCMLGRLVSGSACITFGLLIILPDKYFFGTCVAVRLIAGSGSAMWTAAAMSILMKTTSYTTNTVVTCMETMEAMGWAFGPAIGAGIYSVGGYGPIFWFLGGLSISLIPLLATLVPHVKEDSHDKMKNFFDLLLIPGVFLVFVQCIVVRLVTNSMNTQISAWYIDEFGTRISTISLIYSISLILYGISSVLTSMIIGKGYIYSGMIGGWIAFLPFQLLTAPSPLLDFVFHAKSFFWLTTVVINLKMVFLPILYMTPFQASLHLAEVNGHTRHSLHTYGMVSGMVTSGLCIGGVVGPIMAGAITQAIGFPWMTTVLAFFIILMVLVLAGFLIIMTVTKQPLRLEDIQKTKNDNTGSKVVRQINDRLGQFFKAAKGGLDTTPSKIIPSSDDTEEMNSN